MTQNKVFETEPTFNHGCFLGRRCRLRHQCNLAAKYAANDTPDYDVGDDDTHDADAHDA